MARSADWTALHRHLADMLARPGVTLYDVQDYLLSENNKHGHRRCTGRLTYPDGVPTLGYCHSWDCWIHAQTRLWLERKRIIHGAKQFASRGNLWFITLYPSDATEDTTSDTAKQAYVQRITNFIASLHSKARRHGVTLHHLHTHGLKSQRATSPFQLHTHLLCDWLPSPVSRPTGKRPHRHRDAWLEPRAKALGLTVWIELADSADKVAGYTADNIQDTLGVALPDGFQRVVPCRKVKGKPDSGWPELPPKARPDPLIEFGEWLGATVTVSDDQLVTEKKPSVWSCPNCGQQIFSDRAELPDICDYCADFTTWTPLDGDTLSCITHQLIEIPDTASAPARHLDAAKPDAVQLALELPSPVSAVTDLRKLKTANKTARCGALHRADFQTSEQKALSDGLYHAFRRRTQTTPCHHRRKHARQHCRREKPP